MTRRLAALAALLALVLVTVAGPVGATASATGSSCTTASAPARPVLAVIGASFSAGVGAHGQSRAWPADLGRLLHLRVVVSAVPGAGFISPGAGHRGPFDVLAGKLNLAELRPAVVLIQGGHNDVGRPVAVLRNRVHGLIASIHCASPASRIGIISVFAKSRGATPADHAADRMIVDAARAADPGVLVFDPIAQRWSFPRIADGLHPTPAGHRWIAATIAAGLR